MHIILSLFVIKGKRKNSLVVVVLQYTLTCNNVNYKNHVNIYIHTPDSQKKKNIHPPMDLNLKFYYYWSQEKPHYYLIQI